MLRPTPGESLRGVRTELATQVLPALTDPVAIRQLRASLHVLGMLEKTWDLLPAYLAADNDDIASTVRSLLEVVGDSDPGATYSTVSGLLHPASPPDAVMFPGVTDFTLGNLMAENARLQRALSEFIELWQVDRDTNGPHDGFISDQLLSLNERMVSRMMAAGGLDRV
ncbi:hypothetical protein BH09ACT6_BH09ACT6_07070 [soil metagenome]